MINWIKKQKYKIAIALCSLLSIFTLFLGISKIYAYESDRFSYTIDYSNETFITIGDYQGILLSLSDSHTFNLIDNTNFNNSYLMINFVVINSNNQPIINTNNNLQFTIYYGVSSNQYTSIVGGIPQSTSYIMPMITRPFTNTVTTGSTLLINYYGGSNSIYKLLIVNIDLVNKSDIGLSQYYETYYGQIEDNYNTLLDNYNDLQDDYTSLEDNYNTLQDNYDDLEQDYNNALTTINNASTIRQYLDFTNINAYISYNNNLNNLELSFNQLIDNNILVNSSLYINRIQSYLITNDYISTNEPYFTMRINFDNSIAHLNWSNLQWYVKNDNLNASAFTFEMDDIANNETYTAYVAVDSGNYVYDVNTFLNHQIGSNFTYIYDDIIAIEESYNYLMSNDFVITCQSQYADGYNVGYTDGLNNASRNYQQDIKDLNDDIRALQEANQSQYQLGYRNGYEVGSNQDFSQSGFTTLLNGIMSYPVNMLRSVFNFEFMGINLFGVLTFFVSLGIVLFVIHRFKK